MAASTKQAEPELHERVVKMLSATYFTPERNHLNENVTVVRTANRGETIRLHPAEEARLDGLGALLPAGADPADAERVQQAKLDAYRAERGDQEALRRHEDRLRQAQPHASSGGGIIRSDAPIEGGAGDLAEWIRQEQPSSDDTVALAEGDPERAEVVLEAEQIATGGTPRPEVQETLEKIIAGG